MKHLLTRGNLTGLMLVCIGMNLVGCATAPPVQSNSYVVLLPNDDGSVGKVQVTGRKGVTTLDKALDSARIASAGSPGILATEGQIKQDFGAAIAIRPKPPASFMLYFLSGGTKLTPESERDLARVIAEVESRQVPDVSVVGHTDTVGDGDQNDKLGMDRATWVGGLLKSAKLTQKNVTIESHGKKNLLIPTQNNTAEPRNRRVEITVR